MIERLKDLPDGVDGLRAVGYLLDQAEARSVLIVELSNHLLIAARRIVRSSRTGAFEPFEHYFSPEEMTPPMPAATVRISQRLSANFHTRK